MYHKFFFLIVFILSLCSCSNNKDVILDTNTKDPYKLYQEGYDAFAVGDYFFANKKEKS